MKAITKKSKESVADNLTLSDVILDIIGLKKPLDYIFLSQEKSYSRRQIQRSLYYLKKKQFVALPARSTKGFILLTKLGMRKLNEKKFQKLNIKPAIWDGKWRLLTFDIPERQRSLRQIFRRKLKEMGFYHFQRSVFVLPYECSKEIAMVANYLNITPCVHLLKTDRFLGDKQLIKNFDLSVPRN